MTQLFIVYGIYIQLLAESSVLVHDQTSRENSGYDQACTATV